MNGFLLKLKSILYSKKEIIYISNSEVRSHKFGFFPVAFFFLLIVWTFFATFSYFDSKKVMIDKDIQISELKSSKQNILLDVKMLKKDVEDVKGFIASLNRYDRLSTITDDVNGSDNSGYYSNSIDAIMDRTKGDMKDVNKMLAKRVDSISEIKNKLNLKGNIQLVSYNKNSDLEQIENNESLNKDLKDSLVLKKSLENNIASLEELEGFINSMPFSSPINYDYVSSPFGKRLDPFLKIPRVHHGVDLVGSYLSNIYAPADGRVVFVGTKSGYGNVVMIEHDYGVKTVYGHLNKYFVKVGQKIKRGDIIAAQGSTGRSTGQHLHYEIVMGDIKYNPMNFIKLGKDFYLDSNI